MLVREGTSFPKTHNLLDLMDLILPVDPTWALLQQDLQILTFYAVAVRYPGNVVLKETAKDAQRMCRDIRKKARVSLGLPE